MKIDEQKLTKVLLEENYITEDDFRKAEAEALKEKISIVAYLIKTGLISRNLIGEALAESFGIVYTDIDLKKPSKEVLDLIPEVFAKEWRVIPAQAVDSVVTVATDNPAKEGLELELKKILPGKQISITYSLPDDIDQAFLLYQKSLETRFSKIIASQGRVAPEILGEIFEDAYAFNASDIHFEPGIKDALVRFRVDGVLKDAGKIPKEFYENILNRIKVESRLRIDEHYAAQDGSMRYTSKVRSESGESRVFDLRTSIVPTVEGEKVVLRVLSSYVEGLALSDLGFSPENKSKIEQVAARPFGMILVVGPTGSGKTTTLYGVLKMLNNRNVNITTIEDPVEYKVSGINQIQTNQETNLTFAKGLRSIVRQDPDIILVGEIRDEETAEIAVNAALTGHLLLSTFHSNDAATAIPRLLDMNIEPFLLASTVEIIIGQRLVRKICDVCRFSVEVTEEDVAKQFKAAASFFPGKHTLYKGKGCNACAGTGYKGRTAIFEFIEITSPMEELILKNPSSSEIWKLAKSEGARSLFEDGIEKVKNGVTTLEELLRVAPPPEAH
ncbi:MAG: type II/IV secretion system protein [Candidatus Pacebacteria bacterium]|nr:type II/IV secretion system protein [Candidatus Paceibacterota bacterium]MBP9851498.1 type II/IV secretion system protein [Candidatus Paceibacterota bacterium]